VPNHDHWPTPHLRNRGVCHQRGSIVAGKQTTPDSVRRKQVYEKVAEHWMLLARLDYLVYDETITEQSQDRDG
jgi:hypothetical protein